MDAAAEVFCEALKPSWPAPGLDGLAMAEIHSAFGYCDVAFFRSSQAVKGPVELQDQTSIVKTSKAPDRACRWSNSALVGVSEELGRNGSTRRAKEGELRLSDAAKRRTEWTSAALYRWRSKMGCCTVSLAGIGCL